MSSKVPENDFYQRSATIPAGETSQAKLLLAGGTPGWYKVTQVIKSDKMRSQSPTDVQDVEQESRLW